VFGVALLWIERIVWDIFSLLYAFWNFVLQLWGFLLIGAFVFAESLYWFCVLVLFLKCSFALLRVFCAGEQFV